MPIRLIGPRALIQPLDPTPKSDLIILTNRTVPQAGIVLQVGKYVCPDCGAKAALHDIQVGDRVFVPSTVGQEITIEGVVHWVVELEDLTAAWEPSQPAVSTEGQAAHVR